MRGLGVLEELCRAAASPPVGAPMNFFTSVAHKRFHLQKGVAEHGCAFLYLFPSVAGPSPARKAGAALSPLPRSCGDALTETLDTARILEYNIETYYHYYKRAGRVALPERRKL